MDPPPPPFRRLQRTSTGLVLLAAAIGLLGGLVPGIEHAVASGRLPDWMDPTPLLDDPAAGSASGEASLVGAVVWSCSAVGGLALRRLGSRIGTAVLLLLLAVCLSVNAVLPLSEDGAVWSGLGVVQSAAVGVGILLRAPLTPALRANGADDAFSRRRPVLTPSGSGSRAGATARRRR